jgi:hypothetical protein
MGRVKYAPISTPAAGADWSFTPSGTDAIRVLAIIGTLTTSSTADTRVPALQLVSQDGEIVYQSAPSVSQVASLADIWQWDASQHGSSFAGLYAASESINTVAMPDMWIPHYWKYQSKTYLLQTGDQWSSLFAIYVDDFDPSESQVNAYNASVT